MQFDISSVMLTEIKKTRLEKLVQGLDTISAEEGVEFARLLLDADAKIASLEEQVKQNKELIDGEIQKHMDALTAYVLNGLNLK